ncbi:alpha/beta hydrolase family protein [Nocardioides sp. SYSU DS0663]|uniref:alpha/beta hydrolase family protein n=1 Tax=Nocardioides sp. SYSU DS0663 TaxID=3416445 RepID=UPI003F4C98A2
MRAVLAVALAVAFVLVTTGASGERPSETVRSTLAGQSVRLSLPGGGIEPRGLVVWFHGQGGNVNDRVDGPWLDSLRRDGWAIASSEFHRKSWGNAASTKDAARLIEWAGDQTGLEPSLWVAGSMGATVSLNALVHGVQPPPCWYGVKPAIDLTEMDQVPGGPGWIRKAYGGPVPADRNPVRNLDRLPADTRYRIVSSKTDEWVMWDENTQPLVANLRARGVEHSLLDVEGPHQHPSHFNARDLVAFAESCL